MSRVRRWHLLLIPVPVFGWLLLLAHALDEYSSGNEGVGSKRLELDPGTSRTDRLLAAAVDYCLVMLAWAALPPAFGWLLGACYLLFRDASGFPPSLGKRIAQMEARLSYADSFARNLPLLIPYIGPLVETTLVLLARPRLGDRLAGLTR